MGLEQKILAENPAQTGHQGMRVNSFFDDRRESGFSRAIQEVSCPARISTDASQSCVGDAESA
jgi:hypothetical protein